MIFSSASVVFILYWEAVTMDTTSSLVWLSTWLVAAGLVEQSIAQSYTSFPLHVFSIPPPYQSWTSRPSTPPLSRKLISSYPTDTLVQSNTLFYSPNANLARSYLLRNPIPGKSPVIFRPNNLLSQNAPLKDEYIRFGNKLKFEDEDDLVAKSSQTSGYIVDNSFLTNVGRQSVPVSYWPTRTVQVKPIGLSVYSNNADTKNGNPKFRFAKEESALVSPETVQNSSPDVGNSQSPSDGMSYVSHNPRQYFKKDKYGRVVFGYHTGDQTRMEARDADSKVYGAYTYIDPSGNPVRMQYWDEGNGFHTAGNTLPQNFESARILPVNSVTDTPEVQAARDLHFKLYEQTLATLINSNGLRIPPDSAVYQEPFEEKEGAPSDVQTSTIATTKEEDDDEVIIDSQKLPDIFPTSNESETKPDEPNLKEDEETKNNEENEKQKKDTQKDLGPVRGVNPTTPNTFESADDLESVIIENPELKGVSKRSTIQKQMLNKREKRNSHHFFNGNDYSSQVPNTYPNGIYDPHYHQPYFATFSYSNMVSTPGEKKGDVPIGAPYTDFLKIENQGKKTFNGFLPNYNGFNSFETPGTHAKFPGKPVFQTANRIEDETHSNVPASVPSPILPSQPFSLYFDEYCKNFFENHNEFPGDSLSHPPSNGANPEDSNSYSSEKTSIDNNASQKSEAQIPIPNKTSPSKSHSSLPPTDYSLRPSEKYVPQATPFSSSYFGDNNQNKNPASFGLNAGFTNFQYSTPDPQFYPQEPLIPNINQYYHNPYQFSGSFAHASSTSKSSSHSSGDTDLYNLQHNPQLVLSKPFVNHDYTLLQKNPPSIEFYLFFSNPNFAPVPGYSTPNGPNVNQNPENDMKVKMTPNIEKDPQSLKPNSDENVNSGTSEPAVTEDSTNIKNEGTYTEKNSPPSGNIGTEIPASNENPTNSGSSLNENPSTGEESPNLNDKKTDSEESQPKNTESSSSDEKFLNIDIRGFNPNRLAEKIDEAEDREESTDRDGTIQPSTLIEGNGSSTSSSIVPKPNENQDTKDVSLSKEEKNGDSSLVLDGRLIVNEDSSSTIVVDVATEGVVEFTETSGKYEEETTYLPEKSSYDNSDEKNSAASASENSENAPNLVRRNAANTMKQ